MSFYARNPILPGFYPDPSICAVGEDFYLISSTFAYFPGIPIMHSKDLARWEQVGNVLNRKSQLPLEKCGHSEGIFAPTIRYHNGVYYIVCTNISGGGNFIVHATSPEGPWSEPVYIEGAEGIDPSLFFDEDGSCYYIGTHPNPQGVKYDGDWYIWIQEFDIASMKLIGEPKDVWNGAMKNIIWPEGPHIYKRNDYYYIVHAEGGTGPNHAVTVCRSKSIWGPYENNFRNPIITHRHFGKEYPIQYVGHADLVETVSGDWYMVMLAVRPERGYTTLGRETFLAEVIWEDDWPVVNPGKGKLTENVLINLEPWEPLEDLNSYTYINGRKNLVTEKNNFYNFENMRSIGSEWLYLRNPYEELYQLVEGKGLYLYGNNHTITENDSPTFIGVRQRHHQCNVRTILDISNLALEDIAGVVILQSNEYHVRLEIKKYIKDDSKTLWMQGYIMLCQQGIKEIVEECIFQIPEEQIIGLSISIKDLYMNCSIRVDKKIKFFEKRINISMLSTEVAGGFVGRTIGVYTSARKKNSNSCVCLKQFIYQGI